MRTWRSFFLTALSTAMLCTVLAVSPLSAQEGFGFGPADGGAEAPAAGTAESGAVTLGGGVDIAAFAFMGDLGAIGDISIGDLASARLGVSATGGSVDAFLGLGFSRTLLADDPAAAFREARLRIYIGQSYIEGGLMKLAWGKADSQGPLDVLNPVDLTDLSVTDSLERRIARPMLHLSLGLGQASRLEAVFLPSFEGNRLATSGVWEPGQVAGFDAMMDGFATGYGIPALADITYASLLPETATLAYSQAGLRFTATSGPVDWGLQYYYGYLPTPAASVVLGASPSVSLAYSRYHQAGADLAAVLAGFSLRAELAANITEDLAGDDPAVYNPALAFSLGFDRDLFAGINLNLQYAGSYRFGDEGITSAYDVEHGSTAFASSLTAVLRQGLFKGALEWQLTFLWELAEEDWLFMPSITWNPGDAAIELSAGVFGGDEAGNLGQYVDESYLKLVMGYDF